jgi:predicted MFS family arabinose efflux permease
VGSTISFNLANPLSDAFGWRGVWWFGAVAALVAAVLVGLALGKASEQITEPQSVAVKPGDHAQGHPPGSLWPWLLNPASWLLAMVLGAFSLCMVTYSTWAPMFFMESLGLGKGTASFYGSLIFTVGIVGNVVAGLVIDRTRDRYRMLILYCLLASMLFLGSFSLSSAALVGVYMVILGGVASFVITSIFTLAPATVPVPRHAAMGVSIAMVGSSLGTLVGPPFLGAVLSSGPWWLGGVSLGAVMGLGTAVAFVIWRQQRNV